MLRPCVKSLFSLAILTVFTTHCGSSEVATKLAEDAMDEISHHIEAIDTPADVQKQILMQPWHLAPTFQHALSPETDGSVELAAIINTAKQAWQFIEENEAVSNVQYKYANAIPKGAKESDLSGFSDLQFESYRMYGTNLYGITVYDVTYTLVHQYGGNFDGKGAYLATVSVVPRNVDVLWGYTLDYNVSRVSVTNVGTEDRPIASLAMELSFKVSTIIKKHTSTQVFQFRGNSPRVKMR